MSNTNDFVILEPPDAPQDVKITEEDKRSARITWSVPYSGNSAITSYIIQYKQEDGQLIFYNKHYNIEQVKVQITDNKL